MTMQRVAPARIKLPNGLIAVMYPASHRKMKKILEACVDYASDNANGAKTVHLLFKPDFGGRKILKVNFAETTVYLVLVSTMRCAKDLTARVSAQGFRALFEFVIYFVFHGEACYYTDFKAKVLATAIKQNLDPNICALME